MNVEIIERLRDAARTHGEVADLLEVLAECFPTFQENYDFHGGLKAAEYLESAIIAAQFAAFDRVGERRKDGN